ncbi:hypothetical protein [Psittacicella gerlachiana]|uniref:Uncharacterized protein n=1 Tax=Psittacicella gerlachiana TaxID=2028574 RepID=A0A3A1YH48_9GAMM|nr:hypothetical protein [Psittacicella gerlachiana]RIY36786.1 hypothetical protein CKF59_02275 [Psittacicella gerlachiana]
MIAYPLSQLFTFVDKAHSTHDYWKLNDLEVGASFTSAPLALLEKVNNKTKLELLKAQKGDLVILSKKRHLVGYLAFIAPSELWFRVTNFANTEPAKVLSFNQDLLLPEYAQYLALSFVHLLNEKADFFTLPQTSILDNLSYFIPSKAEQEKLLTTSIASMINNWQLAMQQLQAETTQKIHSLLKPLLEESLVLSQNLNFPKLGVSKLSKEKFSEFLSNYSSLTHEQVNKISASLNREQRDKIARNYQELINLNQTLALKLEALFYCRLTAILKYPQSYV